MSTGAVHTELNVQLVTHILYTTSCRGREMADCNTHVQYNVMQEERIVLYPDPRYMHTGGLAEGLGKD